MFRHSLPWPRLGLAYMNGLPCLALPRPPCVLAFLSCMPRCRCLPFLQLRLGREGGRTRSRARSRSPLLVEGSPFAMCVCSVCSQDGDRQEAGGRGTSSRVKHVPLLVPVPNCPVRGVACLSLLSVSCFFGQPEQRKTHALLASPTPPSISLAFSISFFFFFFSVSLTRRDHTSLQHLGTAH